MPEQTKKRYVVKKTVSTIFIWGFDNQYKYIPQGKTLRVQCLASAIIHWTDDNWETTHDMPTLDSGAGIHYADLPTKHLDPEQKITYTFYWQAAGTWENKNYTLAMEKAPAVPVTPKVRAKNRRNATR